ncbi:MAG: hypothetical protein V4495_27545 [Pseudomonadota bacterium]
MLNLKGMRREVDGTWVLESRNPNERTYSDVSITPENVGLLKIIGRFVDRPRWLISLCGGIAYICVSAISVAPSSC